MSTVKKQVEITVHLPEQPSAMGRLMATIGTCGAEILAACSRSGAEGAENVMLVTDNAPRALRALTAAGFECQESSILLVQVPDKPGLAALLVAKLTVARIRVLYSYSIHANEDQGYVVFKTTDDHRAFYLLEVESLVHELAAAKSWRHPNVIPFEEQEVEPQAA